MWPLKPDARTEAFARYWDALVRGAPAEELAPLRERADPTLIAATERVRADYRPRRADPAFVARLEQALMSTFPSAYAGTVPLHPHRLDQINGRVASRERPVWLPALPGSRSRRRWATAQLAAALLLIVTLFAGYLLIRPQGNFEINGPLVASPVPASTPPSVPSFRGNPARTGVMPGPGPNGKPSRRWRFATSEAFAGSPIIADGVVYIGSGYVNGAPRDRSGALFAIDATSGEPIWRFETDSPVLTSPLVAGETVYADDALGTLYAVDSVSGKARWHVTLGGRGGEAVLVDDVIYVATTSAQTDAPPPMVTMADGAVFVPSTPTIGDPTSMLYAIDAGTGTVRWQTDAFADDQAAYYAFDAATGAPRWSFAFPGPFVEFGAAGGGALIFGDASQGVIYAVDIVTGQERWRYGTQGELWEGNLPVIAQETVFAGTKLGRFFALDAATGEERWSVQLETDYLANSATFAGGVLYIAAMRGVVFALLPADGSELWRYDVLEASQVHASPTIVGGIVYLAVYGSGNSGVLFALADRAGTPVAS